MTKIATAQIALARYSAAQCMRTSTQIDDATVAVFYANGTPRGQVTPETTTLLVERGWIVHLTGHQYVVTERGHAKLQRAAVEARALTGKGRQCRLRKSIY